MLAESHFRQRVRGAAPTMPGQIIVIARKDALRARTHQLAEKRDTAQVILDAAESLCVTHGIEAMSIRDVAAAAGVSIPVIYHHFKSRANLLRSILVTRFDEIRDEFRRAVAELEVQESPAVRDIVAAVLRPINEWRKPGRELSLQFYSLALVCPLPEVKDVIDAGVVRFQGVVALFQRALPHLTHEDICWRFHLMVKIAHQTRLDMERLAILSKGACNSADRDEALARSIAFVEAAFLAPPFTPVEKSAKRGRTTARRGRKQAAPAGRR